MYGPSKPLYEIQKKLQYKKHLERLQEIHRERSNRVFQKQTTKQLKRKRNLSTNFNAKKHDQQLKQQNLKLFNKIIDIAKGRSKSSLVAEDDYPTMIYYQNKERKRLKKEIIDNNIILAQRILSKHSQFDASNTKKITSQYERIKKMLVRNKRATLPLLEEKTFRQIRSVEKKRRTLQNSSTTLQVKL